MSMYGSPDSVLSGSGAGATEPFLLYSSSVALTNGRLLQVASDLSLTHDVTNKITTIGKALGIKSVGIFAADQFENPVNSDWAINALAPAIADEDATSEVVRAFDDTIEEGVGFEWWVPNFSTTMNMVLFHRARTAPAGARTIGLKLYKRDSPDGAVRQAWNAGVVMADASVGADEFLTYTSYSISLASLSVTPNRITKFEMTRINPSAGTELVGDWYLRNMAFYFT